MQQNEIHVFNAIISDFGGLKNMLGWFSIFFEMRIYQVNWWVCFTLKSLLTPIDTQKNVSMSMMTLCIGKVRMVDVRHCQPNQQPK